MASNSWKEAGGKGSITVDKEVLVVENFAREQWEVRDLLADLRKDLIPRPEKELKTVGDKIRSLAQNIFKRGDANGDGLISGAEFAGFQAFDRDKNQQVTLDECVEYVRQVRFVRDRRK